MKKFKKIAYIILIVIIVVLSLLIYTNTNKNNQETQKEKISSEIKFIESKFINIFNTINNIEFENYDISTTELSKQTIEKAENNNYSDSQSEESSSSKGQESIDNLNSDEDKIETNDEQNNKKFELKSNGVLTNKKDINWDYIKTEVENLYTSLPTITIDFYQSNINQENILSFNKEYDNLTVFVKNEKKEETLVQLSKLYDYLPEFFKNSEQDEVESILVETKSNIFKGYSKLDTENWQEIANDTKNAIDNYSNLLTKTNLESEKQYKINKIYIMLNEIQNAVNMNDKEVFLIKYRNLLEEINNV